MKNTKSINRQPSILAHVQRKKITHNEQFLLMKKMQEERLRNQKGNIVEKSQAKSMTRDEIKYAKLGMELQDISMHLSKETSFLKHVKKMAKLAEEEYIQELSPSQRRKKRGSISKSPQVSPECSPTVRGSLKIGLNGT